MLIATMGAGDAAELGKAAILERLLPKLKTIDELQPALPAIAKTEEFLAALKSSEMPEEWFSLYYRHHTTEGLDPWAAFKKERIKGDARELKVTRTI